MAVSVPELDGMPESQAASLLTSCCGSTGWVARLLQRRPFGSRDALVTTSELIWQELTPADWVEAFSHHPRIGASNVSGWSAAEQSEVSVAADSVRAELAEANRQYEERFGYTYIVCATGKSAPELLAIARARLANEPGVELAIAAMELQKITRLRLEKLFQ